VLTFVMVACVFAAIGIAAWQARPLTGARVAAHACAFFLVLAVTVIGTIGPLFVPSELIGSTGAVIGILLFLFLPALTGAFVPMVARSILRRFAPHEVRPRREGRNSSTDDASG
jgi:hypothetical protein